jgi:translation initiation factor IF-2
MTDALRVGLILDNADEREYRETGELVLGFLENEDFTDAEIVFKAGDVQGLVEAHVDLLVLDYGGIAHAGAGDIAAFHVRKVIEWAQEHPSSAVVIWTYHTQNVYERAVKQDFGEMPNVFLIGKILPSEFSPVFKQVLIWLGRGAPLPAMPA